MDDPLQSAVRAAKSGILAQSTRMRVVSENLANQQSTGAGPGSDPYVRKTIAFTEVIDSASGISAVDIGAVERSRTPHRLEHLPGHPAADSRGLVKMPNVEPLVELADMREAQRGYLANIQMLRHAREAITSIIDLMRGQ